MLETSRGSTHEHGTQRSQAHDTRGVAGALPDRIPFALAVAWKYEKFVVAVAVVIVVDSGSHKVTQ